MLRQLERCVLHRHIIRLTYPDSLHPQIYIVKDAWKDDQRDFEGDIYATIWNPSPTPPEGVAELYSFAKVKILGVPDTTSRIRHQMDPHGNPRVFYVDQTSVHFPADDANMDSRMVPGSHNHHREHNPEAPRAVPPQVMEHTRLVVGTYGYTVKMFRDPLELVRTLIGVVKGTSHLAQCLSIPKGMFT